jgi:hypothetical protein
VDGLTSIARFKSENNYALIPNNISQNNLPQLHPEHLDQFRLVNSFIFYKYTKLTGIPRTGSKANKHATYLDEPNIVAIVCPSGEIA